MSLYTLFVLPSIKGFEIVGQGENIIGADIKPSADGNYLLGVHNPLSAFIHAVMLLAYADHLGHFPLRQIEIFSEILQSLVIILHTLSPLPKVYHTYKNM